MLLKNETYRAAKYLRLSRDDGDKAESDSIGNQRIFIDEFIKKQSDITLVSEYVDDGYSGSNFDRPSFKKMMDDVKAKKINCIIVKDLSRFGRNYIDTGNYIERVFPVIGVRFIAINDNYDSAKECWQGDDIIIPFKNLINDTYCRDASTKTRSHLEVKRKAGQYVGNYTRYGYLKDPKDKNHLVIDEYAAGIVRYIYEKRLSGMSMMTIAKALNMSGVLPPAEYKRRIGINYCSGFKTSRNPKWFAKTVERILTDEVYLGTAVQGKYRKINYRVKKSLNVPKKDWVRVENTHEAIITRDMYDKVQLLMKMDTRTQTGQEVVYLLSGFLFCGDCGGSMVRRMVRTAYGTYNYYICSAHRCDKTCTPHTIREETIKNAVMQAIRTQVEYALKIESVLAYSAELPGIKKGVREVDVQIARLDEDIKRYNDLKAKLYQDLQDGIVSRDEYTEISVRFTDKIQKINGSKTTLLEKREKLQTETYKFHPWVDELKKYKNIETLDRAVLIALIDKIIVYDNKTIEVRFLFQDELAEMSRLVELQSGKEGEVV